MKLSTKGRYGLKAMYVLAENYGKGSISLNTIAENQSVSVSYLEKLIAPLRKAGYVQSQRGAQGGYVLLKQPAEITVGEILRLLEGSLAPSSCLEDGDDEGCSHAGICVTRPVMKRIKESIDQVVNSITLQDMIDENNDEMTGGILL